MTPLGRRQQEGRSAIDAGWCAGLATAFVVVVATTLVAVAEPEAPRVLPSASIATVAEAAPPPGQFGLHPTLEASTAGGVVSLRRTAFDLGHIEPGHFGDLEPAR